ncbi:hypothetical protein [Stenotrophobium rhamnosiphilum]|uniref:Uncharacterized protein n=1 Tax=Stenotrophobium rhamnosiphilum TaxID=2029166 RepID=A0A2T5MED1_9GAMM|nr:hypothetical protein [Stenotrophobium rhamnosiphilum]PTU30912.1 hypothetical protein CJD38_11410 [Stenotrophobium rhamnosiphilum]
MFKKIIQTVTAAALLASSFSVIAKADPMQTVYPVKGKMTMLTRVDNPNDGSKKLLTITFDNKKLVRMAMGMTPNAPTPGEANWVLGYAPRDGTLFSCYAAIVVWDKVAGEIIGELASIDACASPSALNSFPATGKKGTNRYLSSIRFKLLTPEGCSQSENSLRYELAPLSGLNDFSETTPGQIATKYSLSKIFGDVTELNTATRGLITDGSFVVTAKKSLGETRKNLAMNCELEE